MDELRAYIDNLENDEPHTEEEWREIIKAESQDFEKQDEREVNYVLSELKKAGFVKPFNKKWKLTLKIATGNWYENGDLEFGKEIHIEFSDLEDLDKQLDLLDENDYKNAYVGDMDLGSWLNEHIEEIDE